MGYTKRVSIPRSDYPRTLPLEALTAIKAKALPLGLQPSKDVQAIDRDAARDAERIVARIRLELEAEKDHTSAPHPEPHWYAPTGTWSWPGDRSSARHHATCPTCHPDAVRIHR